MSGPIVRTGTTPEFWKNWDNVFGGSKKKGASGAGKQPASAAKKSPAKKAGKKTTKKKGA